MELDAVLITGATGFIGRAVVDRAMASRMRIRALVRRPVSCFPAIVEPVVVSDLADIANQSGVLRDVKTVVHLAAKVHAMPEQSGHNEPDYVRTNTLATLALARQAAEAGVRRFVYVSSIKVNGEYTLPGHPYTPYDRPNPCDPYALSKSEAEQRLMEVACDTGLEVAIIRPPLVYGPGVGANFLAMMTWLYRRIPLPLAAVSNKRSLVALDNLVDLILICSRHANAANQVFLVSDGEDVSTPDLIRRLGRAMGCPARLFPVPPALLLAVATALGKRAVASRLLGTLQVDITKTREMLGWEPPVTLDEGLRRTAACFIAQRENRGVSSTYGARK